MLNYNEKELEKYIQYEFKNKALLKQARHKCAVC